MSRKLYRNKKYGGVGRTILAVVLTAAFVIGAGLLLYPTVSNFINEWQNAGVIDSYEEEVESREEALLQEQLQMAQAYNAAHRVNTIIDPFDEDADPEAGKEYAGLLNPLGNDTMGYIVIPKIDVELAIYHGVGTSALEQGIGHIEGTSLPVGGEGTHAVLSGHRGLPGAKLFTDLDQIEGGDRFYITVLGETLAYEVDQIIVVEPDQTESLAIQEGKDLVTLVTCTPYGINSHRLLIRGHRIPYDNAEKEVKETVQKNNSSQKRIIIVVVAAAAAAAVLTAVLLGIRRRRKKRIRGDGPEKPGNGKE